MQTCIWPSGCHCHSLSLASVKSRLVLPFWYRLTWVVSDKGPFNGCVCVAAYRSTRISVLTTSKKINLTEVECFPECILTDNRMLKQSDKLKVNFSGGHGHHGKSRHPPTTHRPNLETSTRSSKSQPSGSSSSATTSVAFANLCYIYVLNNNNIFTQ